MMKEYITLILLFFLGSVSLPAQKNAQKNWAIGARAGVIGVPYNLSSDRLGTGVRLGLSFAANTSNKFTYYYALDYSKVDNLALEKLKQQIIVLPDGLYRSTEFISTTGFAALGLGLRMDREIKDFDSGKLKLGFHARIEWLTEVRTIKESRLYTGNFSSALVEREFGNLLSRPVNDLSSSIEQVETDVGSLVFVTGIGLVYEFDAGLQLMLNVLLDYNTRFSEFKESSDARLTQVQIGFNYPLLTKFN